MGGGFIGGVNNGLLFLNSGTVNANASGQTLVLETTAGAATNTGLMAASNGGTLQLYSTTVNNAGRQCHGQRWQYCEPGRLDHQWRDA